MLSEDNTSEDTFEKEYSNAESMAIYLLDFPLIDQSNCSKIIFN